MIKNKFKYIAVVYGGTSGERAVSLESGRACIKALKKKKYKVIPFDPKIKNLNLLSKKKSTQSLMLYTVKMVKMVLHKVILNI